MAALFTDEARLGLWLEVELLSIEGFAALGLVRPELATEARRRAPAPTAELVAAVAERERVTDHDFGAFVDVVQAAIGPPAAQWVHYGLTSSDVEDTALGVTLSRAADLLIDASTGLIRALKQRALELAEVPMAGRTHGVHAEPTTFGTKLALWCLQVDRDRTRLRAARKAVAVGKLSGPVGTYSNVEPAIEAHVCRALGLQPAPSTQVVARDRHAEYLFACASAGTTVESFATEIRHLQRTEVGEAEEPFAAGQKGSSAMPHKRNPILSERLCGLARLLRGYLGAGLEDVALWHERDISHSSVERVVLPDASLLAYYVLTRMTRLVEGLVVHPERMRENLEASGGLVYSQPLLLALVDAGLDRDQAYRIVQRDAQVARDEGKPLRTVLEADPEVTLGETAMEEVFSLRRALRNTPHVIGAVKEVEA
jgi:adenylosuccinate lyase